MCTELKNPRKWRYTWEAQSHLPILKLFLFHPKTSPKTLFTCLKSQLSPHKSLLKTTWLQTGTECCSVTVPVPRVLIDGDAAVQCKAMDDHIEVKVVLVLPVDHPIVVGFGLSEEEESVSVETDLRSLGLGSEGVRFYCRSCSVQLTRPIKSFSEMPSTNWSEVADNWFGGCCCSFGGISDKLVAKYANSYASAAGMCLLTTTFIALSKDDLVQSNFLCGDESEVDDTVVEFKNIKILEDTRQYIGIEHGREAYYDDLKKDTISRNDSREVEVASDLEHRLQRPDKVTNGGKRSNMSAVSQLSNDVFSASECCGNGAHNLAHVTEHGCVETLETSWEDQSLIKTFELPENQKSFLNGFLGDIFMAKSSNLSADVHWVEFLCPQCSSFLGAYPVDNDRTILDGGIRLFKCYISTCLPTGGSNDLLKKYTLEKMFTNQLVENAKTELSYRTLIRDLQTKNAMLQIVLLNPNSFLQGGYCSGTENKLEAVEKVDLSSAIKVLFADCSRNSESRIRTVEEWVAKNQADEVYMFPHQIKELIETLNLAKEMFPLSCTFLQGLSLSAMRR